MNNLPRFVFLLVFLFSLLFGIFLTYGFSFFWEDVERYFDSETRQIISYAPAQTIRNYTMELFSTDSFFCIANHDRPLRGSVCQMIPVTFFKKNIELYHLYKSIFFAVSAVIVFWIILKFTNFGFAILGLFYYITSRDVFSSLYQVHNEMLYGQAFFMLFIFLFIRYYISFEKISLSVKAIYFIGMLFSLRNSMLISQDGRYFFVMLFIFLVLQGRKHFFRHFFLLASIIFLSLPVLGILKFLLFDHSYQFIFNENTNLFSNFLSSWHNYLFIVDLFSTANIALLLLMVLILPISLFSAKIKSGIARISSEKLGWPWLSFFLLWFIFTFAMGLSNRGLGVPSNELYTPTTFNRYEFSYCIAPFIIFLCLFCFFIINSFSRRIKILLSAIVFLLLSCGLLNQVYALNQYRGAWGDYFNAWANAGRYIESKYNNSLVLVGDSLHQPFVFLKTNNRTVLVANPDLEYFCAGPGECNDIFVLTRTKDSFVNKGKRFELIEEKVFGGDTNSPYSFVKNILKRGSQEKIYLYHFKKLR